MGQETSYGGQAVIEGVMMRGKKSMALAVRKPDGEILVNKYPLKPMAGKWKILRLPFVRGTFVLIESLILGINTLMESANYFIDDEEEELNAGEVVITLLLGLALSIGLFIVLPAFIIRFWVEGVIDRPLLLNLAEGFVRIAIFLIYLFIISRMKDIQRVFEYHGAEHKVIHAYEAGEKLNVDNAAKYSTMHPRCGTSFLLVVMVVSVLVFSILGKQTLFMRILSRILLFPVVAGISYEVIRLAGKRNKSRFVGWLTAPGLWLQALTTRQPDMEQLEVAIAALEGVLLQEEPLTLRVGSRENHLGVED